MLGRIITRTHTIALDMHIVLYVVHGYREFANQRTRSNPKVGSSQSSYQSIQFHLRPPNRIELINRLDELN